MAVWEFVHRQGIFGSSLFIEITEQHSRFEDLAQHLKQEHRVQLERIGVPSTEIPQHPLFDTHENIVQRIDSFIANAEENVIIDLSCLPKRYFFPFVRRLLDSPKIKSLVAAYTAPLKYYDGILAEDPRSLAHLPLFGSEDYPEPKASLAVISIGFVPLGIGELVDSDRQDAKFKLLFPFPPGPPFYQRNWRFLVELQSRLPMHSEPIRVEAYNVSDAFDHLVELTDHGNIKAVFAPYGPKPISLAMCLFATQSRSPVFYTQPQIYNPQYSSGILRVNGEAMSYGYCIRIGGKCLYDVGLTGDSAELPKE